MEAPKGNGSRVFLVLNLACRRGEGLPSRLAPLTTRYPLKRRLNHLQADLEVSEYRKIS
jgi:hypothetical protein